MNILNRLTLRNLRLNKKRTIVTIIGIILSGAMICGVASLVASFQDLFIQSAISTDGNYHATFYAVPYEDSKYLSDNINTKSTLLTQDIGFAKFENAKDSTRPFIFIMAYNGKAFTDMPITLKEGRFPEKNSEIVVSEQLLSLLSNKSVNYKIGQEITLPIGNRIDNGELLSPKDEISKTEAFEQLGTTAYTITGVIEKPRFEPSLYLQAISYLDEGILAPTDLLNVSILTNKPRNIYKIVPQMAEAIGINNFSYNNELLKWMGISKNSNYINMLMSVGLIIIGLIVVGSVTVIYNAFAISVSERKKQFGMLSSVGATAKQIRKTIFFEGFLLGIIGIPIGILSGILGIGVTIKIISPLMQGSLVNTDVALRLVVSPLVVGITVFFVAFVILISAYIPAKRASSISPIEAIRLNTDINIKGKKLKTSKLTRLLFGFEGEIALKNLKRNRRRYRATVFSLFISIVLFISFSTFTTYGFQSSKMYYSEIPYDIYVNKYDAPIDKLREFYNKINELEDIDKYVILRHISVFASESNPDDSKFGPYTKINFPDKGLNNEPFSVALNIYTLNDEAFNQYMIDNNLEPSEFKDEKNLRAILINKAVTNINQKYTEYQPTTISKGDILRLEEPPFDNNQAPAEIALEVAAITDIFPFGLSNSNSIDLIVSEKNYEVIRASLNEVNQIQADSIEIIIATQKPAELEKSIKEIHDQYYGGEVYIYNVSAAQEEMNQTKTVIPIFLYGFVTLITLIGVTNIFNTISTNVALRRREFAMLKSVGLTPKGFNKMINYESIFYGLKALLYGLPISILISIALYNSFGNAFSFQFMLPWKSIIVCIVGVFLITFLTMIHASRKLKNDNIVDTLKEENL